MVKLDKCVGSWFNMITGKNESKILTKDMSCQCKSRSERKKYNSDQWWKNDKCLCECKKCHVCEKRLYLESCYM